MERISFWIHTPHPGSLFLPFNGNFLKTVTKVNLDQIAPDLKIPLPFLALCSLTSVTVDCSNVDGLLLARATKEAWMNIARFIMLWKTEYNR